MVPRADPKMVVVSNDGNSAMDPREIYIDDWDKLADDDPAGDIAFPLT